jgi:acyl-coenzyme A synthetase/AMP-(fatty) acid ligase
MVSTFDIIDRMKSELSNSRSVICDDRDSLSYHECGKLVAESRGNVSASFDALTVRNKLPEALQVISHLVNQQSFLVLNGALKTDHLKENITTFCQNIITFKTFDKLVFSEISSLSLTSENPFYVPGNSSFDSKRSYLVLKTSGTTNQPKFVLHDQKLALKNSKRSAERLGLAPDDRVLIPVSIHHSYGLVTAFFPALIAGCSIKLIGNTNIISLMEAIRSFKPTVLFATPSLIEMLLKVTTRVSIPKVTITAGDKIREDLFLKYEAKIGTLLNLYGSTEMGAMAVSDINQEPGHRAKGGLTALPGIQFNVRNGDDELSTILCRNDCGYVQYLNYRGEDITAPRDADEWFDTKDLGKLDEKEVRVLGRADHKINRNGILLSYFEIESAIELACSDLRKVIVVKLTTQDIMGTQFAAVCELKEQSNVDEDRIKKECLEKLSRSMVPDLIEIVDAMPLLPNGKVDRNFLQKRFYDIGPGQINVGRKEADAV